MNKTIWYFSAPWCQPCKAFGPTMDRVDKMVPVKKVNIDYEPDAPGKYGVTSIPTIILVENEQPVKRHTGVMSYNDVLRWADINNA
jgi:thioredoxin 1